VKKENGSVEVEEEKRSDTVMELMDS